MLSSWWRKIRGQDGSVQSQAEGEVNKAKEQVLETKEEIGRQLQELTQQQQMLQGMLQAAVRRGAPKKELMELSQKIKHTEKNITTKRRLVGNMHREEQQLADAVSNSRMASAMVHSLEAQRQLQKVQFEGKEEDLEDILDEIEEHRDTTRDLSDRLAAQGGDSDEELFDEQTFSASDVVAALGMRTDKADDILLGEISGQMSAEWQRQADALPHSLHDLEDSNATYVLPDAPPAIRNTTTSRATRSAGFSNF